VPGNNVACEYIVVDGGTAGLILATRLAEQQSGRVVSCHHEIGNGNISQVPAKAGVYTGKSKDDW
jgi:choline dehydrogenase